MDFFTLFLALRGALKRPKPTKNLPKYAGGSIDQRAKRSLQERQGVFFGGREALFRAEETRERFVEQQPPGCTFLRLGRAQEGLGSLHQLKQRLASEYTLKLV